MDLPTDLRNLIQEFAGTPMSHLHNDLNAAFCSYIVRVYEGMHKKELKLGARRGYPVLPEESDILIRLAEHEWHLCDNRLRVIESGFANSDVLKQHIPVDPLIPVWGIEDVWVPILEN